MIMHFKFGFQLKLTALEICQMELVCQVDVVKLPKLFKICSYFT